MVYRRARGGVPSKTTFLPINNKVAKKVPGETFFTMFFPSYTPAERIHLSRFKRQLLKERAERIFGIKPTATEMERRRMFALNMPVIW